jgi:hypothetical protein
MSLIAKEGSRQNTSKGIDVWFVVKKEVRKKSRIHESVLVPLLGIEPKSVFKIG